MRKRMPATDCHSCGSDVFVSCANGATNARLSFGMRSSSFDEKNDGTCEWVADTWIVGNSEITTSAVATTVAAAATRRDAGCDLSRRDRFPSMKTATSNPAKRYTYIISRLASRFETSGISSIHRRGSVMLVIVPLM